MLSKGFYVSMTKNGDEEEARGQVYIGDHSWSLFFK